MHRTLIECGGVLAEAKDKRFQRKHASSINSEVEGNVKFATSGGSRFCYKITSQHMKVVKFLGGLGNQMFQYAFYLSLKQCFKAVKVDLIGFDDYPLHNGYELERVFSVSVETISSFERSLYTPDNRDWVWRKLRRLYGTKDAFFEERNGFCFDESIYQDKKNRYYWGYWQHIAYVNRVEAQLRQDFTFPPSTDSTYLALRNKIKDENTVSVHVRRGDYLGHSILGGICDQKYYEKAIEAAKVQLASPQFVFFSNDIPWCKETFSAEKAVFVDCNQGEQSYRDMELMSLCQHHIIANSSFSWWGAWLNPSPNKMVISPSQWVNDQVVDLSGMVLPSFIQVR